MHKKYVFSDRSYSGIIKKELKQLGESVGFGERKLGEIDIIVSELISNLTKYADARGEFLARRINKGGVEGLEIICIDNGAGMKYPEKMLTDGLSTSGSLGQGLGAIKRLSNEFDLYSLSGWGTVILCRIFLKTIVPEDSNMDYGGIAVAVGNETECGDSWSIKKEKNRIGILAVDGLGHGENASRAALEAINYFNKSRHRDAVSLLRALHAEIRKTRGVACLNAYMDADNDIITYAGIGNISAKVISVEDTKNCVSFNGIVGYAIPATLKESRVKWQRNDIFIIHSDGINARWDLGILSNIERHDPVIIAAAIYKDYKRSYDDSLVLVCKRKLK